MNASEFPAQDLILPDDAYNRELIANVRPPSWKNPTPDGTYNLVAIGGGTAGLVSAIGAAGLGAKVALVERHLLGGDCLNVGCVPSKGLISAARAVHAIRRASELGVIESVPEFKVDFGAAMLRMRKLRTRISHNDSAKRFSDAGVDIFIGQATFTGPNELEVDGTKLKFKKAVIATGARADAPPIPGLDTVEYLTNETIFSLTELPRRLLVIGAGPIGCEMAQSFRRLGSEVTAIDMAPHVLIREDQDAAAVLQRQIEREGMVLKLEASIKGIEKRGDEIVMKIETPAGGEEELVGDELLVAVGRKPNVEGLGLEKANVEYDPRKGVLVDDTLRTSNRNIYAAGDICSLFKFTHTADFQARIVIQNALFPGPNKRASDLVVPWVTYTDPEIAHVGYYEKDAEEAGYDVLTLTQPFDEVDRAILESDEAGFARVHLEKKTGRILGATIVAPHAGEMIGEMCVAVTHKLTIGQVGSSIHPYPTQAEAMRKLGDVYNRTRLGPGLKKFLTKYFSWRR